MFLLGVNECANGLVFIYYEQHICNLARLVIVYYTIHISDNLTLSHNKNHLSLELKLENQ